MAEMILMYISKEEAEKLAEEYYKDEQRKIKKLVDNILFKLKFIDIDSEDFYSLADEIFMDVLKRYDGKQSFEGFLYSCLLNKFKTEMTRRNRQKRQADRMAVSIDTPIGDKKNITIGDMIADDFNLDEVIFGEDSDKSFKIEKYLNCLSKQQRKVAELLALSYGAGEIQKMLHITQREYSDAMSGIRAYENISILF